MTMYRMLDELQAELYLGNWRSLEEKYRSMCMEASKEEALRIQQLSLAKYKDELKVCFSQVVEAMKNNGTQACYFEYDMDNGWGGNFFLCDEYTPVKDEDDDWACGWHVDIKGPDLLEFAEIYSRYGFDRSETGRHVVMCLIARTVTAFAEVAAEFPLEVPVCIAFHDQDPIMRLHRDSEV